MLTVSRSYYAHLSWQVTQAQSHPFLECCITGVVEDDSVRVDVDAVGVDSCALGLDECDAMFHACAVSLLPMENIDVKTVALVEAGVVEVAQAGWRRSAVEPP